jgi:SAM-dependent methyltransferase
MAEPLAEWLQLREPADTAARSATLTQAIADSLQRAEPLRILDLGTGTGSNVRYLAPRLPTPQRWLVVDRDATLLASVRAPVRLCEIETRAMELGALDDPAIFAGRDLVTASALLDLVSDRWLAALADRCRAAGAAVLFALNYDGRSHCAPIEPEDAEILMLFNRHQRQSDKGFGAAAGPDAADRAVEQFAGAGYRVQRESSNWFLAPDTQELQRQLVEGWAEASEEMAPDRAPMIRDWLARRLAHVRAGRSHIIVCHEDVAAWP